jgi:ribosomal protein S18 acetylase RimI-like enzyme
LPPLYRSDNPANPLVSDFDIVELDAGDSAVVRVILEALPEWFGLADARESYITNASRLPMIVAQTHEGKAIGFLSLKHHTDAAAEAYVLGVHREHHRHGCGRAMFDAAERRLAAEGVRYLSVKTIAADHPDQNYAATRRFYEAIGFEPIEVFPTLWNEDNPCLLMIKRIARADAAIQRP